MKIPKQYKGYWILFIGALIGSGNYLCTKYGFQLYPQANLINTMFWSFFTGIIFTPFFVYKKSNQKILVNELTKHKNLLLKSILLSSIGVVLWFYSMKFGTPGTISFLKKSDIIVTFLFGTFFLKERISKKELSGAIIAITGFVILSNSSLSETPVLSILAIIMAQVFYVLQSFFIKKEGQNINSFAFSFIRILGMAILMGLFGISTNQISLPELEFILFFGFGRIISGFLFRSAYFEAHKYLEISKISTFLLVSPVIILFTSYILLHESITLNKCIGAGIILCGLIIFTVKKTQETN
ncbi:hypothetical protein CSB37_00170 [bacterium DOLZORAL124_38_8]|nr:MAG: hypothetical protein CSB37_00170 [bacterium DOLZORAL124_38_8]